MLVEGPILKVLSTGKYYPYQTLRTASTRFKKIVRNKDDVPVKFTYAKAKEPTVLEDKPAQVFVCQYMLSLACQIQQATTNCKFFEQLEQALLVLCY